MLAKSDYLTYFYEILCEIKNYLWLFYGVLLTYEDAFFSDLNIFYLPPPAWCFSKVPLLKVTPKKGATLDFLLQSLVIFLILSLQSLVTFWSQIFRLFYC